MRVILPDGEATMVSKRRQLRDEEVLRDRDLDFLIKLRQGRTKRDVAFAYRITVRQLNGRLAAIPPEVRMAVHRLVDRCEASHLPFVPDAALDGIRRAMSRRDRVARRVGALQTA